MSKIEAWKTFINGRIALEKGEIGAGLKAIDQAIDLDPTEPAFQRSRSIAAALLVSPNDAGAVSELSGRYNELARANSGPNDNPETWIKDLEGLLGRTDALKSVTAIVW